MKAERGFRLLFFSLLLANAIVYAYAFVARQQDSAARQISILQINPEKIRLIGHGGAPVNTSSACLEWGVFAGPDVARADAAIAKLELPQALVQRSIADAGGYWVYVPALKTKAEVDKKILELKTLGIADFFVVQDQGQWRNAISLGIFKTEDGAKTFLAALNDKGVKSAVAERRENFLKQIAYYVREPSAAMVAKLAQLQRDFPGSEIKALACPPTDAAAKNP